MEDHQHPGFSHNSGVRISQLYYKGKSLNYTFTETKETIKTTETHIVPTLDAPIRLQEYGVGIFIAAATKSALKKALKKQWITVNKVIATSATIINGGEEITLTLTQPACPKKKLVLPLQVIFEDDYLAVVVKPAGILVSGNRFKTIANALAQNIKASTLPDATAPQPVHRLDYATTGILLVGKTSSSIRALNNLFEEKAIKKTYYAITIGEMAAQGKIALAIDDKPAQSLYKCIDSVASERFGRLNLVELVPQTGRRHQLRKHLQSLGNPILGDKHYGFEELILTGKGLYLHAYSLAFKHPFTQKEVSFSAEFPIKFKNIFADIV